MWYSVYKWCATYLSASPSGNRTVSFCKETKSERIVSRRGRLDRRQVGQRNLRSRSDVGPPSSLSADLLGLLPGSDPKNGERKLIVRLFKFLNRLLIIHFHFHLNAWKCWKGKNCFFSLREKWRVPKKPVFLYRSFIWYDNL